MAIHGYHKGLTWPDNFLCALFGSDDAEDIKKYIELKLNNIGLAMKDLSPNERLVFNALFKTDNATYSSILKSDDFEIERQLGRPVSDIKAIAESAIDKLRHPKRLKRFIKFK